MTRRLRPGPAVIVMAGCVWDDGEELSPGPQFGQATVPLADLKGSPFYDQLMASVAQAEAQALEAETSA